MRVASECGSAESLPDKAEASGFHQRFAWFEQQRSRNNFRRIRELRSRAVVFLVAAKFKHRGVLPGVEIINPYQTAVLQPRGLYIPPHQDKQLLAFPSGFDDLQFTALIPQPFKHHADVSHRGELQSENRSYFQ